MAVSIDGKEQTQVVTSDRTVGDLLNDVKSLLTEEGKMIVGIVCDGQLLTPEEVETALGKSAASYSQIDFQSAEPRELARNSLEACLNLIAGMEATIADVVDALQKSEVPRAMGQMGPMFGRLNDTYRGLQGVFQLMRIDPESVELSSGSAASSMAGVVDRLREIKDALENRDYVQLADLFAYELKPTIEQWRQLIANLTESLDQS
jgi:hypothetical protein